MAIKIKAASYGPAIAALNADGELVYGTELGALSKTPELDSPAMTMLYSVASCMVLSLQMVAKRKKIEVQPFSFEVIGHKGTELPMHFARYEVALSAGVHADPEVAQKLLKDAKAICTVSNSLSGSFELSIKEEG
ncbi:OsmC family protein [Vibrio sp. SCSIO 43136]|uniref:OsmC family protein n=1 Tax=Vibrio sp. SCSIO 43136 TaxID=2819101 RepID=UPI002075C32C|nr:OsmC family protein [Vibrio sp. SCSIO 43136]USD64301.1 OsmC family protein [Vibrio sp. SCSIO 43136]